MLVYEYKLDGTKTQSAAIDEAIRTVQFIRHTCLRKWMYEGGVSTNNLPTFCAVLAKQYPFAGRLNSQARQASADRAWFALSRFYENCQINQPGKKGHPKLQHDNCSVEYKQTGWKLEPDGKHIIFTDGCGIGRLRLVRTRKVETFPIKQMKRVRIINRADGYYAQCEVKTERHIEHVPSGKQVGIDVGLKAFLTDAQGTIVDNPRHSRKAEKQLKQLQRCLSRKKKGSKHRRKARQTLAKGYLKVQGQREDFARKQANALVLSSDLIAYEQLQIRHMLRNRHLAISGEVSNCGIHVTSDLVGFLCMCIAMIWLGLRFTCSEKLHSLQLLMTDVSILGTLAYLLLLFERAWHGTLQGLAERRASLCASSPG